MRTPSSPTSSPSSCTSTSKTAPSTSSTWPVPATPSAPRPDLDLDLLVLGSGIAGLSAAVRAATERALVDAGRSTAAAVLEHWFALDLIVEEGRCRGVVALDASGARREVRAAHTLVASGGAGQLFSVTTNPEQATGDGVAMAVRAGVPVADVEFMQFHPTALHHPQMPRPLLSEALRGHGALLRDASGERFVDELASRDVVAKAMTARMLEQGTDHLSLDATGLHPFDARFPTIAAAVRAVGLDPTKDWLPIAPAAHYLSGGLVTDLCGASALPGLWACGEVACTGVHGANRLASNSLIEGMVFAPRVIEAIEAGREEARPTGAMRAVMGGQAEIPGRPLALPALPPVTGADDAEKLRSELQRTMTAGAGVLRDGSSLDATAAGLADVARVAADPEVRNLAEAGWALVHAARAREESRGAHSRLDFPATSPEFLVRLVIS